MFVRINCQNIINKLIIYNNFTNINLNPASAHKLLYDIWVIKPRQEKMRNTVRKENSGKNTGTYGWTHRNNSLDTTFSTKVK